MYTQALAKLHRWELRGLSDLILEFSLTMIASLMANTTGDFFFSSQKEQFYIQIAIGLIFILGKTLELAINLMVYEHLGKNA